MAARRLEISLRVLKNISRVSAIFIIIIIINTNEIPHHFTFILFLSQKSQLHTNPPYRNSTFVLILIVCVFRDIESLTITRLFMITAVCMAGVIMIKCRP